MRSSKLRLLSLERRIVPATIEWDGGPTGNGTDWFDPINWKGDALPGSKDQANLGSTGTNPTISLTNTAAVQVIVCSRAISISAGGSLSIGAGNSLLDDVTLSGGTVEFQDGAMVAFADIMGSGSVTVEANRTVHWYECTSAVPVSVKGTLNVGSNFNAGALVTIENGGKVTIAGDTSFTSLNIDAGLTNHGTLELTSVAANQQAVVWVDGGPLTNASNGVIVTRIGLGGSRHIQLGPGIQFINQGQTLVQGGLNVTRLGTGQLVVNSGTIQVDAAKLLNVTPAFQHAGGSLAGAGAASLTALDLTANWTPSIPLLSLGGLTGTSKLTVPTTTTVQTLVAAKLNAPIDLSGSLIVRGSCTMSANLNVTGSGVVHVRGDATLGATVFRTMSTVLNSGTIELTSVGAANNASLIIQGGAFTHAAGAHIKVIAGDGGSRFLTVSSGTFSQQGQITLVDTTLFYSGPTFTNNGTLSLAPGSTFSTTAQINNVSPGIITGAGTIKSGLLFGNGSVTLGSPLGILTLDSSVNLSGPVVIDLNGTTPGLTHDQLKVLGTVTLSGPLTINLGYTPQVNDSFVILDNNGSDTITGSFSNLGDGKTVTVNGATMEIDYEGGTGNDVTLKVLAVGSPPPTATIQVNDGSAQRSMVTAFHVTFSEAVVFPDGPAAGFQLTRIGPGDPIDEVTLDIFGSGTNYDITFNDPILAPGIAESLIDGRYILTLIASKIQGAGGSLNGGSNQLFNAHRLFGDADGNATVNSSDFAAFRSVFGTGTSIFDINGDNSTNSNDFAAFRGRFGITLAP